MGQSDAQLFRSLARVTQQRIGTFNAQDLAHAAWAFATTGHSNAQLFTALAWIAERRVDDFNGQDLANTV